MCKEGEEPWSLLHIIYIYNLEWIIDIRTITIKLLEESVGGKHSSCSDFKETLTTSLMFLLLRCGAEFLSLWCGTDLVTHLYSKWNMAEMMGWLLKDYSFLLVFSFSSSLSVFTLGEASCNVIKRGPYSEEWKAQITWWKDESHEWAWKQILISSSLNRTAVWTTTDSRLQPHERLSWNYPAKLFPNSWLTWK